MYITGYGKPHVLHSIERKLPFQVMSRKGDHENHDTRLPTIKHLPETLQDFV